ncbi:hypothetical protein [Vibrio lentus]|uniref:hypothetical protein n=1 Tax=Vibrio lentus TaxID=136468 RepID=UPI000C859F0A|nr:hypothetical protein [Vibrio lentus]
MSYNVKKIECDSKGTRYGIFIDTVMLHVEYRRTRATEIVEDLQRGKVLAEIITPDIARAEQRKCKKLLEDEGRKTSRLALELYNVKKLIPSKEEKKPLNIISELVDSNSDTSSKPPTKLMLKYDMNRIEGLELSALIEEVKSKGFRYSKELSNYIIRNKLKQKYPNISGVVKMEKSGEQWNFSGGFPKRIYGIICSELNLSDQGTTAKAVGFKSFKEIDGLF